MTTQFTTNEYNVTEDQLSTSFDGFIENVDYLNLWNIQLSPSGHGHYAIEATFNVNEKELVIKTKTNDMQLVDAWKTGVYDFDQREDAYFDTWDEVVASMLSTIDAEENIVEFIED